MDCKLIEKKIQKVIRNGKYKFFEDGEKFLIFKEKDFNGNHSMMSCNQDGFYVICCSGDYHDEVKVCYLSYGLDDCDKAIYQALLNVKTIKRCSECDSFMIYNLEGFCNDHILEGMNIRIDDGSKAMKTYKCRNQRKCDDCISV